MSEWLLSISQQTSAGQEDEEGNLGAILVGVQTDAATVESSMEVPQIIKNRIALWPSNSTSVYISEETPNTNWKRCMYPYVHCSIIYSHQAMEGTQVSIDKGLDKEAVVHTYNRLLVDHKKGWSLTICDSMDGPRGHYDRWNKSVRERHIPCNFIYVGSKEQNKWTNKIETDS